MHIGCPKEIKPQEFRVGMTPNAVGEATRHGHNVMVQAGAGAGSGFLDTEYQSAGAQIVETAEEVFASCDMIVKVKEPQAVEVLNCAKTSCYSPICIWHQTLRKRRIFWPLVAPQLLMKQ